MNRIHFRIDDELLSKIEEYMKNNNCTKTKALISLLEVGLEKTNTSLDIQEMKKLMNKLNSRNNFNRILLEQLYSDLEIENLTDTKKNKALQELKTKKFKDSFND